MSEPFNAMDSVVIKDDFYDNPDEIRELALTKNYEEPPAGTPRLAVTAVCTEAESRDMFDRLAAYLPQQMSAEEVAAKVKEVAAAIDYQGGKDTGRFMKEWMSKYKGLADGKMVQAALRELG